MQGALGSDLSTTKLKEINRILERGMVASSTLEGGGRRIRESKAILATQPFVASLGNMRPCPEGEKSSKRGVLILGSPPCPPATLPVLHEGRRSVANQMCGKRPDREGP